jgi:hypothetical protein
MCNNTSKPAQLAKFKDTPAPHFSTEIFASERDSLGESEGQPGGF